MTETEAKWSERVERWRASGQSAEKFAEGEGFKSSTLRYWASHLRTKIAPVAMASESAPSETSTPIRVVRVRRRSARESSLTRQADATARLVIAIGGARIELQRGFDRALLSEVLEVLGGAR